MVESAEFPHIFKKSGMLAMPKVVINEDIQFEVACLEQVMRVNQG